MTQQRDDIVGRLEELVSSGRKLEPVAGSLLTIHLDMLEEAAAEITRLRAENAEAEQRGARAGLAAALNALKTVMQSETLSELIRAAYLAGAEDVHNAWVNGLGQSEPDFGEAASDYAASVDPKPSANSTGLVEEMARTDLMRTIYARALEDMRIALLEIRDGLEDEGDRIYLGSTNHADHLKAAWATADALNWDEILTHTQPKTALAEVNLSLQVTLAAKDAEIARLNALADEQARYANLKKDECLRLREAVNALRKIMPIRVENGPDYAEVYFADGSTHSTQAMTMNPQDWLDIAAALSKQETGHG